MFNSSTLALILAGMFAYCAAVLPAAASAQDPLSLPAAAEQNSAVIINGDAASYQGEAIKVRLPVIPDQTLLPMQEYFSSTAAAFLHDSLPYYEHDGQNIFALKTDYRPEEVLSLAKLSDFFHTRSNAQAAASHTYSNIYHLQADFEVKLSSERYLSVLQYIYTYTGGAHGMTYRYSKTADRRTGKMLSLQQIFAAPDYLTVLNQLARMQNQDIHFFQPVTLTGKEDFYLTDQELTVYYQLYEVAPYAAGFIEYHFPYDQIAPLLAIKID